MSIYVVDQIMGSGKTTAMIRFIKEASLEQPFLYITPYLDEVSRIMDSCSGKEFCEPKEEGGKTANLTRLMNRGRNVVCTHALFSRMTEEAISAAKEFGYILIMDEAAEALKQLPVTVHDAESMLAQYVAVDPGTRNVTWTDTDYEGKLTEYREVIERGHVYEYSQNYWIEAIPPEQLLSFRDVYILTYRYSSQIMRCYCDLYDINYEYQYVTGTSSDTYRLCDEPPAVMETDYTNLIHIIENDKLNSIGEEPTALSRSWYDRQLPGSKMLERLKRNTTNYFKNITKSPSHRNLWTTYSGESRLGVKWKQVLSGPKYTKSFLACNARGTNNYRDRTALAYLINRFPDPSMVNFLREKGIAFDPEEYALSELLQWIWRSAIRDGQEITIYIPSRRMRELLKKWIQSSVKAQTEPGLSEDSPGPSVSEGSDKEQTAEMLSVYLISGVGMNPVPSVNTEIEEAKID